jgi:two-component system CitB family sensor kinase
VLFVVITNNQGIRLSHPNRDELGQYVSTDPAEALTGHEAVLRQSDTLGPSVRAKDPGIAAEFGSSGRRGQRRYLDGSGSSAIVE